MELDADIVNLNEIEDCEVLKELLAQLPKGHGYRYYMVQGGDVATGTVVIADGRLTAGCRTESRDSDSR
jgi:hypothetical protein